MVGWNEEDGLKWRALAPFGVEIDHDLSEPLSSAQAEWLRTLFRDYALIVAHGQALTIEQQRALIALFGPVLANRTGEGGYISTEHEHRSARAGLSFHSDQAYTPHPFDALSLHAVDVVDGASSTRFIHAEQAWAALPAALLGPLASRAVEMVSPGPEETEVRACHRPELVPTHRETLPAVRVNPHNGRSYLAVSELSASRLEGMDQAESCALLDAVFEQLYAPERQYEHVWRTGDIVMWDNIALQHARGSLAGAGRRVLQRAIAGIQATPH